MSAVFAEIDSCFLDGILFNLSCGHALTHKSKKLLLLFGIENLLGLEDVGNDFSLNLILNTSYFFPHSLYLNWIDLSLPQKFSETLIFPLHGNSQFSKSFMELLSQRLHLSQLMGGKTQLLSYRGRPLLLQFTDNRGEYSRILSKTPS